MKIPAYRRHSSGQARVTIDAKDHLLGPYNSRESRAKYRELIQQYLSKKPDQKICKGDGSIAYCLVAYLDYAKTYYRASREFANLRHSLKAVVEFQNQKATEFGPKLFKQIRQHWIDRQVSRQFVNKAMSHVRRWVKWCVSEELMLAEIYQAITCVEPLKAGRTQLPEAKRVRPIDLAIVDKTIEQMPEVVADMVRLQRITAARPAEICAITPSMIDRSKDVWEIHYSEHKTAWRGRSRIVYVGCQGQEILRKYLLRDPSQACFSPREAMEQRRADAAAKRKTPPNQGNRRGYTTRSRAGHKIYEVADCYDTTTYRQAIQYACTKAKVETWSPNQLRHTRSTEIRKQFGLEASQVILGHAKCDVTQIYAEADRELAIAVVRKSG